ncbi:transposase [Candidatus Dependentiae bacterium]|nr:transposase [Candidatus Dependentiae bacterium]
MLPPSRPQYNGTVERGHRIVKYEFYYQYCGVNVLWKIRNKLHEFTHFYNTFRPHQHLNYMTPMQYSIQISQLEGKKSHMY